MMFDVRLCKTQEFTTTIVVEARDAGALDVDMGYIKEWAEENADWEGECIWAEDILVDEIKERGETDPHLSLIDEENRAKTRELLTQITKNKDAVANIIGMDLSFLDAEDVGVLCNS